MDVKAAVAFEAGKPLSVTHVQLEGPRAGGEGVDDVQPTLGVEGDPLRAAEAVPPSGGLTRR